MTILIKVKYVKSILEGRAAPLPTRHLPLKDVRFSPMGWLAEIAVGASPNTTFEKRQDAAFALALRCGPSDYCRVAKVISGAILKGRKCDLSFSSAFNLESSVNQKHIVDILVRQAGLHAAGQIAVLHPALAAEFWAPVFNLACSDSWAHKVNNQIATDMRITAFKDVLPTLLKADPNLAREAVANIGAIAAVVQQRNGDSRVMIAASDFLDLHIRTFRKLNSAASPDVRQQMNAEGVFGRSKALDLSKLIEQVNGTSFAQPVQSRPGIIRSLFQSAQPS